MATTGPGLTGTVHGEPSYVTRYSRAATAMTMQTTTRVGPSDLVLSDGFKEPVEALTDGATHFCYNGARTSVMDTGGQRITEDREAAFQRYLELSAPYFAAVEAAGDTPWFSSIEERREMYMRRHRTMTPTKETA